LEPAAAFAAAKGELRLVIDATGVLHDGSPSAGEELCRLVPKWRLSFNTAMIYDLCIAGERLRTVSISPDPASRRRSFRLAEFPKLPKQARQSGNRKIIPPGLDVLKDSFASGD
jgi:hypothetical protein